jgi:predicted transcriptional regulator YdeE
MEVCIIQKPQLMLAGLAFFGDPFLCREEWAEENALRTLWQRFLTYQERTRVDVVDERFYEVHIEHPETGRTGFFEIFLGVKVPDVRSVPVELLLKVLPESTYATFTLSKAQIVADWPRKVSQEWLPGSGYQLAHKYDIQVYASWIREFQHEGIRDIEVYIPIINRRIA